MVCLTNGRGGLCTVRCEESKGRKGGESKASKEPRIWTSVDGAHTSYNFVMDLHYAHDSPIQVLRVCHNPDALDLVAIAGDTSVDVLRVVRTLVARLRLTVLTFRRPQQHASASRLSTSDSASLLLPGRHAQCLLHTVTNGISSMHISPWEGLLLILSQTCGSQRRLCASSSHQIVQRPVGSIPLRRWTHWTPWQCQRHGFLWWAVG